MTEPPDLIALFNRYSTAEAAYATAATTANLTAVLNAVRAIKDHIAPLDVVRLP
jgi:hypothetical protein